MNAELQGAGPGARSAPVEGHEPALRERYLAYRRREAAELLSLLPREALRPLYAEARRRALEDGLHDHQDPMPTLLQYCEALLPLPPFDVWREDLASHPAAHLSALASSPEAGSRAGAVTLEVRPVADPSGPEGGPWRASLRVFREGDVWRGYIAFERASDDPAARTADVFRDAAPEGILQRFLELEPSTLTAFLRSALP